MPAEILDLGALQGIALMVAIQHNVSCYWHYEYRFRGGEPLCCYSRFTWTTADHVKADRRRSVVRVKRLVRVFHSVSLTDRAQPMDRFGRRRTTKNS